MRPVISNISECNCLSVRRAARALTNYYEARLAPTGLSASQFGMLVVLRQTDSMSVNRLSEALGIDRTTTGKNLQPLVRDGLVEMAVSTEDRRVREARMTKAGRALLRRAERFWLNAQADLERENGDRALVRLRSSLESLAIPSVQ